MGKHGRRPEQKRATGQPTAKRPKVKSRYEQREIRDSLQQYESIKPSGRKA